MNKYFIVLGLIIFAVGVGWPWIKNFPFGRLPGDITIVKDGFRLFIPITSCLVVSGLLSFILWLLKK